MSVLAKLLVKLSADSAEFQNNMEKASKKTASFETSARQSMDKVGKAAAAMGAAVTAATAVIVKKNLESIDSLAKTADKLGVTTQALGGMRHAANLTGVAYEKFDKSMERMSKNLGDAARGTGEAGKVLEQLNLPIQELINLAPDQAFARISDAVNDLGTQSEKTAAAARIFGEEGVALVNTMKLGSEGLREAAMEAEQLGMVLSRVDAAKVEAANDAMTRAQGAIAGIGQTLTVELAPYIEVIAKQLMGAAKETGGFKAEIEATVKTGIRGAELMARAWSGVSVVYNGLKLDFLDFQLGLWEFLRAMRKVNVEAREFMPDWAGGGEGLEESRRILGEQEAIIARIKIDREEALNAGSKALEIYERIPQNFKAYAAEVQETAQRAAKAVAAASASVQQVSLGNDSEGGNSRAEKLAAQLLQLEESLRTEEERIQASYERRREMVNMAHEEGLITAQRQFQLLESLHLDHQERMQGIEERSLTAQTDMKEKNIQGALDLMQMFNGKSKAIAIAGLAIQKGLAIAETIISTQAAAAAALAPPPLGLGPVAGAGLAAAIEAQGALRVGIIAATGLAQAISGLSGGDTSISSAASPSGNITSTTPAPSEEERRPSGNIYNLYVYGSVVDHDQFAREAFDAFRRVENDRSGR